MSNKYRLCRWLRTPAIGFNCMVDWTESEFVDKTSRLGMNAHCELDMEREEPVVSDDTGAESIEDEPRNVIIGMLAQFKKGMDLHKVPFPTFVLEPRSMLERITDFVSHPQLILR